MRYFVYHCVTTCRGAENHEEERDNEQEHAGEVQITDRSRPRNSPALRETVMVCQIEKESDGPQCT